MKTIAEQIEQAEKWLAHVRANEWVHSTGEMECMEAIVETLKKVQAIEEVMINPTRAIK